MNFAILDAARDYMRIGMARLVSPAHANMYIGEKGQRLDGVAPHLFECDQGAVIAHMTLSGNKPDEAGIMFESESEFPTVYKHFRRYLTVTRERDNKKVLFRFYDPRVLRVFLPACDRSELSQFFGPVDAFHCQGDEPGEVLTFKLTDSGELTATSSTFVQFYQDRYGINPDEIRPIPEPPSPPPTNKGVQHIKNLLCRNPQQRKV